MSQEGEVSTIEGLCIAAHLRAVYLYLVATSSQKGNSSNSFGLDLLCDVDNVFARRCLALQPSASARHLSWR